MVQRVNFFCLTCEKLAENEEDVGQTLRLINVAKGFQAFASPLQLLMFANWLSAKLGPMMDMSFLTHLWYSFITLGSTLEGGASLDPSIMFQKFMDVNNILILNFQRLKFPPLNLSMNLVTLLLSDVIIRSEIMLQHSN
jgi:hypothetical protein